jgi:hypothetical protein
MEPLATAGLLDVPLELQLLISSSLDYPSRYALSQINQYFRAILKVERPRTVEQKQAYLFAAEMWKG